MRLLCAVGQRDGALVVREALALLGHVDELTLLHVVDDRPRRDVEAHRGPLRHISPERQREIAAAEESAGQTALAEAEAATRDHATRAITVEARLERGKPEQIIVTLAHELHADVVALRPREHPDAFPQSGPPSVGHTARFVVDHAPCPVLLLRQIVSG